jgi:hypothetical protein
VVPNHWARKLRKLGLEPRQVAPHFVARQRKNGKDAALFGGRTF